MTTITLAEFEALKFEIQKIEVCTANLIEDEYQYSEDETRKTYCHECYGIAIVACGEFKIEYQWDATSGNVQSYAEAFEFKEIGINTSNDAGAVANFKIVSDDEYNGYEFDWLSEVFDELDLVSAIKANLPTPDDEEKIGKNDDENLEWFVIQRDDGPAYKFRGVIIGETESSDNNAHSSYSGSTGHSEKLGLYKTQSGKYVCEKVGYSQWQGQRTRYAACVCDTVLDVGNFFGYGWLAKDLYADAKIEIAIEI